MKKDPEVTRDLFNLKEGDEVIMVYHSSTSFSEPYREITGTVVTPPAMSNGRWATGCCMELQLPCGTKHIHDLFRIHPDSVFSVTNRQPKLNLLEK